MLSSRKEGVPHLQGQEDAQDLQVQEGRLVPEGYQLYQVGRNSRTKCKMRVQQKVRLHCEAQRPAAFTFEACPLHRGPVQCPERPTGGHWGLHMQGARKLPFPLRCGSPSLQGDCSADEGQKFCLRKASGLHQRAQEPLWHVDPAAARRREGVAGSRSGSRSKPELQFISLVS